MFRLVIHPQYMSAVNLRRPPLKDEIILDEGYNEAQAELRGLRWLLYCPTDIVMIEEVAV